MAAAIGVYPQHVIHQCASARAHLDQLDSLALPALHHPLGNDPQADKLSKYLRDLGGGDEVALLSELVAAFGSRCVVAAVGRGEDLTHVRCDGHRAGGLQVVSVAGTASAESNVGSRTVMASVNVFASGVDHLRPSAGESVDDHLAATQLMRGA